MTVQERLGQFVSEYSASQRKAHCGASKHSKLINGLQNIPGRSACVMWCRPMGAALRGTCRACERADSPELKE